MGSYRVACLWYKMLKFLYLNCVRFGGILFNRFSKCTANEQCERICVNTTDGNTPIEPLRLAYKSYEQLPSDPSTTPILILPGLFSSSQQWRGLSKVMHIKSKPTRKVFTLDARNHGESPHSPQHRFVDLAEDVNLFCKEHKIQKAVVIGHSMGGRAMMVFALKYVVGQLKPRMYTCGDFEHYKLPHLVEKAIIVDVSPLKHTSQRCTASILNDLAVIRRLCLPRGVDLLRARIMVNEEMKPLITNKNSRSIYIKNLYRAVDGTIKWRMNIDSLERNLLNKILRYPDPYQLGAQQRRYTNPILFIGASRSDYLTAPDDLTRVREIFPQAELKFLESGHSIQLDARRGFLELAAEFINSN